MTEYAARHESRFVKLLIQQNEIGGKRKTAAATKQLEQAQERIAEVSRIIKRLYEDNVNGKISDERFMELSADYEQEQRELKDRTAALQAELDKSQAATVKISKTIECSLGQMKTPGGASSGGFHYSLLVLGSYSISVHIIRIEGSCSDSASQTLKQITM